VTWLIVEWMSTGKPKLVGLLTGSVAGLATVTPAAGYVSPQSAVVIGIVSGLVCFYAVALKNRLQWDDALDVWGVHGVGGALGIVLLGVFATKAYNPAGGDGLLAGNATFFVRQCLAVLLSTTWAFVFTLGMLWLIDKVVRVRVDETQEETGLDAALHGEEAYLGSM
jgi:Amt family ammonium transporter